MGCGGSAAAARVRAAYVEPPAAAAAEPSAAAGKASADGAGAGDGLKWAVPPGGLLERGVLVLGLDGAASEAGSLADGSGEELARSSPHGASRPASFVSAFAPPEPSDGCAWAAGFDRAGLATLKSLHDAAGFAQLAALVGLLRSPARAARDRAPRVPAVAAEFAGACEEALAEARDLCSAAVDALAGGAGRSEAAVPEALCAVFSGDPALCSQVLESMLAGPLASFELGAVAELAGRLPDGTVGAGHWDRILALCCDLAQGGEDREDRLARMHLVGSLLAAMDALSEEARETPNARLATLAACLDKQTSELAVLSAGGGGWWRVEAAALFARQAVSSLQMYPAADRLRDCVPRLKTTGRILRRLCEEGALVAEEPAAFGGATLLELLLGAGDERREALREAWAEAGVGRGPASGGSLGGPGALNEPGGFGRLRLLAAAGEGGRLEDLEEAVLRRPGELKELASRPPLAAALCGCLVAMAGRGEEASGPVPTESASGGGEEEEEAPASDRAAAWLERLAVAAAGERRGASLRAAVGALEEMAREGYGCATDCLKRLARSKGPAREAAREAAGPLLGAETAGLASTVSPFNAAPRASVMVTPALAAARHQRRVAGLVAKAAGRRRGQGGGLLRAGLAVLPETPQRRLAAALFQYAVRELEGMGVPAERRGSRVGLPSRPDLATPKAGVPADGGVMATVGANRLTVVDMAEHADAFVCRFAPGAPQPIAVGFSSLAPGQERVLLAMGDADSFARPPLLAALHRKACLQLRERRGRPSRAAGAPVTVLARLRPAASREEVAAALGVAEAQLPAVAEQYGLVLLVDCHEGAGADPASLWSGPGCALTWASAAVATARTAYRAALPSTVATLRTLRIRRESLAGGRARQGSVVDPSPPPSPTVAASPGRPRQASVIEAAGPPSRSGSPTRQPPNRRASAF